jgi:hypothetical protein
MELQRIRCWKKQQLAWIELDIMWTIEHCQSTRMKGKVLWAMVERDSWTASKSSNFNESFSSLCIQSIATQLSFKFVEQTSSASTNFCGDIVQRTSTELSELQKLNLCSSLLWNLSLSLWFLTAIARSKGLFCFVVYHCHQIIVIKLIACNLSAFPHHRLCFKLFSEQRTFLSVCRITFWFFSLFSVLEDECGILWMRIQIIYLRRIRTKAVW